MLYNQVNLDRFDIQQARIKFILFKSKLRAILYGGGMDESILSARENALGQWLYNDALKKYGTVPEVREIEKQNLAITSKAKGLVNLYKLGKIDEARTGLRDLDQNEEELNRILGVLQERTGA
ncbi:CZB domain-containing protein [Rufibacter glacialis]|uniref:CZB domain-containing protein n=1 Tax=Rufibacter glacialis TaxID=1259555 RepID=A0A5M8QS60_9BACT|nr:CZB domain-containing protein [Rufibacter glacialis]KAA6437804.1 hypothetical protein FOE74_04710 [Rufibacter glacialis]GGK56120.1 hypothetical protein GCM10011405_00310 [Rufibacter glacialis]